MAARSQSSSVARSRRSRASVAGSASMRSPRAAISARCDGSRSRSAVRSPPSTAARAGPRWDRARSSSPIACANSATQPAPGPSLEIGRHEQRQSICCRRELTTPRGKDGAKQHAPRTARTLCVGRIERPLRVQPATLADLVRERRVRRARDPSPSPAPCAAPRPARRGPAPAASPSPARASTVARSA